MQELPTYTAFLGQHRIASGSLPDVARAAAPFSQGPETLLVFNDTTGQQVDLDLRGTPDEAAARAAKPVSVAAAPPAPRGRGRPQLGVVAREVTLLPRHWEWLALQPGGASVALRKLVEEARRTHSAQDAVRAAQERCYRFSGVLAGNLPGFEEAVRALFAGKSEPFDLATAAWPPDVREHARELAAGAFTTTTTTQHQQ
jgi:hypothetical protein